MSQELENVHPEREGHSVQSFSDVLASMEEYLRPLLPVLRGPEARCLRAGGGATDGGRGHGRAGPWTGGRGHGGGEGHRGVAGAGPQRVGRGQGHLQVPVGWVSGRQEGPHVSIPSSAPKCRG